VEGIGGFDPASRPHAVSPDQMPRPPFRTRFLFRIEAVALTPRDVAILRSRDGSLYSKLDYFAQSVLLAPGRGLSKPFRLSTGNQSGTPAVSALDGFFCSMMQVVNP